MYILKVKTFIPYILKRYIYKENKEKFTSFSEGNRFHSYQMSKKILVKIHLSNKINSRD